MKIYSYTICHYGKSYLAYSLRSVYDHVDKIGIFYVPHFSHGTNIDVPPIESEEELKEVAFSYDPDNKIVWIKGSWRNEGEHRGHAVNWAKSEGADILVNTDTDEVWHTERLKECIEEIKKNPVYTYRIKMYHFWKSFNHICTDEMYQGRIQYLNAPLDSHCYSNVGRPHIFHFGYCQTNDLISYKILAHGHLAEWKENWFEEKYKSWVPGVGDLHPTCVETWDAKFYDKTQLPKILHEHPYFDLDKIE